MWHATVVEIGFLIQPVIQPLATASYIQINTKSYHIIIVKIFKFQVIISLCFPKSRNLKLSKYMQTGILLLDGIARSGACPNTFN